MKKIFIFLLPLLIVYSAAAVAETDLEALIKKGNEAFDRTGYDKALSIYEKGLKAAPEEPVLFYNKGNALHRLEKYEDAVDAFREAMKSKPKRVLLKNIYFNAGNTHLKLAEKKSGESKEIEDLKKALSEFEKSFDMYGKSLDLERKIAIARGSDIHKAGIYARQN